MFVGIILKLYKIQGIKIIKAITTGNKTVQQNDISWSKRIRGNEALAQINTNINIQALNPITILHNKDSANGLYISEFIS